ncbi:MAG: hypothetical protein ACJAUG_001786 [Halioglobus sp.]|jgi:hypothetical protein
MCLLVSCAVPTKSRVEADANAYSAVAATKPDFKPSRGDTVAWYGPPIWADADLRASNQILSVQIQDAVSQQLISRGFKIVDDEAMAKYVIGLGVITKGGERSDELSSFFMVFPQLRSSAAGFDKGTIVAGIVHAKNVKASAVAPNSKEVLWRAGIEAFILGTKLDSVQRLKRVESLASALTASIRL